ncbi:MAG: hypothetical protein AAGG44_06935, partial [Planctomycetota bacterium]
MRSLSTLLIGLLLFSGCVQQIEETGFSNRAASNNILLNGLRVSETEVSVVAASDALDFSFSFLSKQVESNTVDATVTDSFGRVVLKSTAEVSNRGERTAVRMKVRKLKAGSYGVHFRSSDGEVIVRIP